MTTFELDHIFVCVSVGAPEANRLASLGLTEGEPNTHPGQGTANRRFFFHNAMLELIWVHDEQEACSDATRRTRLFERWRDRAATACPFGLCFRPTEKSLPPAFLGWDYTPSYLPAPLSIHIGENSEILEEPMLFQMSFGCRPDKLPDARRQPLEHRIGFREITRVRWIGPIGGSSSTALRAVAGGIFSFEDGPKHRLEIGFDGENQGRSIDLAPELPITLQW